jgi:hypothetical protein
MQWAQALSTLHVAAISGWMKDSSPRSLARIAVHASMTSISVVFSGSDPAHSAVTSRINTDLMGHVMPRAAATE